MYVVPMILCRLNCTMATFTCFNKIITFKNMQLFIPRCSILGTVRITYVFELRENILINNNILICDCINMCLIRLNQSKLRYSKLAADGARSRSELPKLTLHLSVWEAYVCHEIFKTLSRMKITITRN